ncbi:tetratricopeptide repeat protein [Pseudomonas sp. NPDC089534]|uniref:tetratricopeptide repeat protein n=1 Tax=Pseudomonas sp. NPDC089534 TaxID=3364468 RepID=UPI003818807A
MASPVSTGDRGGSFERRVQAVRVLAMCLGLQCPGARDGFVITRLLFQGRVFDHDTDDLIIDLWHPVTGQKATQRLQMKRSLKPTDNKNFNESVGLAWEDFCKPDFRRNVDELLIVYNSSSNTAMHAAQEVLRYAVNSGTADDWYLRVHAEGSSNESNRKAYFAIKRAVELQLGSEVDKVDLYPFALHLKFMPHDLDSDRTIEVDTQKQLISQRTHNRQSGDVWAALQALCAELNGTAGEICLDTAERHLGSLATEFQATRALWDGYQALQSARQNSLGPGSLGDQAGALLNPEAHSQLQPLAELLRPLLGEAGIPQSAVMADELPSARATSSDPHISRHLDRITEWQRAHRYQDCLNQLELLESDLDEFDDHQKARWYLLRGLSLWHQGEDIAAANDFDAAVNLCDSDDRVSAAAVRACMLRDQVQQAVEIGTTLLERFPESFIVWATTTNARILAGERVNEDDIPSAFVDKAAAWQLVASSYAGADDDQGALRAMRIALDKPDCSFFTLESYLRYAIRLATLDPVRVNCRSLLAAHAEMLLDAMSRFDNRDDTVWSAQSPKTISDVVGHLAYSMVLLERAEEALELLQQARMKGVHFTEIMVRVEIEAMCDLNRWQEVTERFQSTLDSMPDEALLRYGHACMAQSRVDLLQIAREEVARRTGSEVAPRIAIMLQHLRWELLLQDGDSTVVRDELEQKGVTPHSTSVIDLCFACRAYEREETLHNRYVDRVSHLAPASSDPQELAIGARAMVRAQRYDDAIGLLEKLLPVDAFTALHVDLLHCYILTGMQAKALNLLQSMPTTWRGSPEAREQALFLYNSAGDWIRMREIMELNLSESPMDANAWLMFLRVTACEGVLDFDSKVADIPVLVEGQVKTLLLLASIEMRHGQVQKGLDRIAYAMRSALGDVEAAATHVQVMLTVSEEISEEMRNVHRAPVMVTPGTSIELADEQGCVRHVTIDFEGATYPPGSSEFIAPHSELASSLLGLGIGGTVSVSNLMGSQHFEVKGLCSFHRRLLELSHKLISDSVVPSKSLVSMTIAQDANGEMDFSFFLKQLDQQRAQVNDLLALYSEHPVTLGLVAKRLGRDIIDIVRGWDHDGPLLQVTSAAGDTHDAFPGLLEGSIWVVDLAMLTELATLGLLDVLGHLTKVYVSTATRRALDMKIESSSVFHNSGTMFSHEGQLGYHEETEDSHALNRAFLKSIDLAISNYCIVVPAYGPLHPTPVLQRLRDLLDMEEHACLTLCHEYQAGLLSLDGRLRQLAQSLDVISATPQMLLKAMVDDGVLRPVEYSRALIRMIIARRNFISISSSDLLAMMDQGLAFANAGIKSLRRYLAVPTVVFGSAATVTMEFICEMYRSGRCTFVVLLELIKHLVEPLFRHPDCPENFVDQSQGVLGRGIPDLTSMHLEFIKLQLVCAKGEAQSPMKIVTLDAYDICLRFAPQYRHHDNSSYLTHLVDHTPAEDEQAAKYLVQDAAEVLQEQAAAYSSAQPESRTKTGDS